MESVTHSVVTHRGHTCGLLRFVVLCASTGLTEETLCTLLAIDSAAEHCAYVHTQKSLDVAGSTAETDCDIEGQVRCPVAGEPPRLSELERYLDKRPMRGLIPIRTDCLTVSLEWGEGWGNDSRTDK
jgi:hypothetical protein